MNSEQQSKGISTPDSVRGKVSSSRNEYDSQELYNAITYPLVETEKADGSEAKNESGSLYNSIVYPGDMDKAPDNSKDRKKPGEKKFESPATLILPRAGKNKLRKSKINSDENGEEAQDCENKKPSPSNIWKLLT